MKVDVAYFHKERKEVEELSGLKQVPKKRFEDRSVYQPTYEVWRTTVADVLKFHYDMHAAEEKAVILNIDGVPLGRTGRSQTIVSIKFVSCRNVYQVTNAIPYGPYGKKYMNDLNFLIADILRSIRDLGLDLKYICADAPMRAFLRNQKNHASKLGCDYCYGEATYRGRPMWGLATLNSKKRTIQSLHEDYEKVASGAQAYADFGYKGRSEILNTLPDFDLIEGVPVDPMHLLYLGVTRALFELLFNVGETRPTNLSEPPQGTRRIDEALAHVKVPTELPRRPRPMDFKNWKGSEWRNLTLVYFPIVAQHLIPGRRREIWLEFCFLCRAYSVDDKYFESLNKDHLKSVAREWYVKYYEAFGSLNLRYNVHLVFHLDRIRVHGPFPDISAFLFEGSFAASSRAQHVGTSSEGLQAMRHSYLRAKQGHTCAKKIEFSTNTTSRRQDDLLYSEKSCFELCETPGPADIFLKVRKIHVSTYFAPDGNHLDFTNVGVFRYISTSRNEQFIRRDKILGKLVLVPVADCEVLVTLSIEQLREAD